MIELLNIDCMEYMKTVPDKYFDLAIVDPPYGIGEGNAKNKTRSSYTGFGGRKTWVSAKDYGGGEFDYSIPSPEYFNELDRICKDRIIWGANYMVHYLDASMGWVVWDKDNGGCDQSDCELAYSSFNKGLRKFTFRWQGLLQGDMKNKENRIHPTQKPVKLYKWLLTNYAKEGQKIFDSHLGSGSIAIACHDLGFDLVGCELDKDYYDAAVKRFNNHKLQSKLF
jgi:site-specific DNA-methyltransferase (adenine-specific)